MRNKRDILFICSLFALLSLSAIFGLCFGSTRQAVFDFFGALARGNYSSAAYRIFMFVRIPRVFAAMLAGSALAVSGVLIQGALSNPLAGPNIIGVNSGAGFMATLAVSLLPAYGSAVPAFAFAGALGAAMLIYLISCRSGASKVTIVLAGVAVSSILSAGIDMLKTLYPDSAVDTYSFLIGGFNGINLQKLFPSCIYIAAGLAAAVAFARALDIMSLGDDVASSLGMRVKAMRFFMIALAALLAGSAVSFSGLLGFVGLIVPHIMRRFARDSRLLVISSAIGGAFFVMICDLISRVLFAPYEIPVGIVMSFIGGPFFLALLVRRRYEL